MNRGQWIVLGIGLEILSGLLFFYANLNCLIFSLGEALMICRYSYSRPAIIFGFLGLLFIICSSLEPKEKTK